MQEQRSFHQYSETICHQPNCALRSDGVDADQLADVIVAVLTGDEIPPDLVASMNTRQDLCRTCVRAIFEKKALPQTAKEALDSARNAAHRQERREGRARRSH